MKDTESRLRRRTEGRLDRSRDPVILNAALASLREHGYQATTVNDIAARAGVGKAAIYRRWASKAALIVDVLVYWRPELLANDVPDTGSLTGDLDEMVERTARNEDNLISNDLILRVALEAVNDPQLADALDGLLLLQGGRVVSTILSRAAARGEIPENGDWPMIADVVTAMSLLRSVNGQPVDAEFFRQLIDKLVLPAARAR